MQRMIDFLRYGNRTMIASLSLTLFGIIYTFVYNDGYNWGIDFSSGVSINLSIEKLDVKVNEIKSILSPIYKTLDINNIISLNKERSDFIIIVKSEITDYVFKTKFQNTVINELKKSLGANVEILESYFIDSRFSSILKIRSIFLSLGTFVFILIYITLRFRLSYAIASILSTVHDIFFVIAFIGVFGIEISSSIIVSILTIIGYSLNDTIVIFDRIRYNLKRFTNNSFSMILNISINQTLSRTILTSVTTFVAVFSIYIFTEGAIKNFALVFMIGVIIGTYSSIFIALPVLFNFHKK